MTPSQLQDPDRDHEQGRTDDDAGRRRRGERRSGQRRREERRAPLPLWRRPAAYAAYGVVGAFFVIIVARALGGGGDGASAESSLGERTAMADEYLMSPLATNYPGRDAYSVAQYERLLAEGDNAVGEIVRTELFCGSINPVAVRETVRPHPTIANLMDGEGRVAGAECRWSQESRSADFFLVVPPHLAEAFARAPEVELNFVRRRQIRAHVEWLGRSDALSLRNSGVLREISY